MGLNNLAKCLRIKNDLVREMLAEIIGTFILVTFAIGSGAQYVLSRHQLSSFLTVNAAGGMGLTLGIYWAGGVSGGYLNPCVTLVFCLRGVTPWRKLPFYALAEFIGAFIAAAVQYVVYYDAINAYDGGVRSTDGPTATAGIFSTFPNPNVSTVNCFFDQVFGTFILIGCILAITDNSNMLPHKGLLPLALGSIVFAIGTSWALNCGYAINPARDLSPRIFTAIAGWGAAPFSYRNYNWFWVPIAGPVCGTFLAWFVYNLFVELHWKQDESTSADVVESSKGKVFPEKGMQNNVESGKGKQEDLESGKEKFAITENGKQNDVKDLGINNKAFVTDDEISSKPASNESTQF